MVDLPFCTLEELEELELVDAMRLLEQQRETLEEMKHQGKTMEKQRDQRCWRNTGEDGNNTGEDGNNAGEDERLSS